MFTISDFEKLSVLYEHGNITSDMYQKLLRRYLDYLLFHTDNFEQGLSTFHLNHTSKHNLVVPISYATGPHGLKHNLEASGHIKILESAESRRLKYLTDQFQRGSLSDKELDERVGLLEKFYSKVYELSLDAHGTFSIVDVNFYNRGNSRVLFTFRICGYFGAVSCHVQVTNIVHLIFISSR